MLTSIVFESWSELMLLLLSLIAALVNGTHGAAVAALVILTAIAAAVLPWTPISRVSPPSFLPFLHLRLLHPVQLHRRSQQNCRPRHDNSRQQHCLSCSRTLCLGDKHLDPLILVRRVACT